MLDILNDVAIELELQTFRSAVTNLLELGVNRKKLRLELEDTMDNWERKLTTRQPVQKELPGPGDFDPPEFTDVSFDPISMEGEIGGFLSDPENLGELLAFNAGENSATEMMCKYLWSFYCGVSDETTDFYQKKLLELLRDTFEREIERIINEDL